MVAVWARWDGSGDRVQTAVLPPGGTWSPPTTLSDGGADANDPQISSGPDGRATAVWHQTQWFSEVVLAAIRNVDGSWSAPAQVSTGFWSSEAPQVASGPDGTVASVWKGRDDFGTRIGAVVRFDAGGVNRCPNEYGLDLNVLYGVPEQFVTRSCRAVGARAAWRPFTYWTMNAVFEQVPPGYVPAAPTPIEDLLAKLQSVKIVIDENTRRERTVTVSPAAALRSDRNHLDYTTYEDLGWTMVASLPKMVSLPAGTHTARTIWTLSAQHCDGLGDVEASNCLPAGDRSLGAYSFTVGSQE
jgi:hypothetical protein